MSFGGGVNSTALKIILDKEGREYEATFVDLGCELPETYENIKRMENITVLKPNVKGYDNIYDFYWAERLVPFIKYRSCTDKFKIQTLKKHHEKPCTVFIGFDVREKHRVQESNIKGITYEYPLIEYGLNRRDCKKIIHDHNIPIPPKSGCYICPFQSRESWWALARDHPDLFWKAVALEENSTGPRLRKHKGWLRDYYPPPKTFEMVEMGCNYCVFGISPIMTKEDNL